MRFDVIIQCGHIRRGFPFRVTGDVCPAEPENGIMESYLDDLDISCARGGTAKWMNLTRDEVREIETEVWEQWRKHD